MDKHDTILLACGTAENRRQIRSVLQERYHLLEADSTPQMLLLLEQNVDCVAALVLLLTVLSGAKVYRSVLESTEITSEKRIRTQYIATKVQQNSDASVEEFDGGQALVLRETVDGQCYVTYIYCHGGWIRELFCREGAAFTRADGEKVIAGETLSLSAEDGLITVETDGDVLYLGAGRRRASP